MDGVNENLLSIPQAAELYSELRGHPKLVCRSRMSRLVAAGRLGVEGRDWGRVGAGRTARLWVTEKAVRQFAAVVRADRDAEVARLGDLWARRAETAAEKAAVYRAAGEVEL